MLKKFPIFAAFFFLASCSSLKQIGSANSTRQSPPPVSTGPKEVKFLDNISTTPSTAQETVVVTEPAKKTVAPAVAKNETHTGTQSIKPKTEAVQFDSNVVPAIEKASTVQLKYAVLLNTNVENVKNQPLYASIDQWYGTRYKYGGTSKYGIDCSAFVQSVFLSAFAVTLPRTASDQYKYVKLISTTQLKEGDLLFFNTTGGVSHVGIYLQNNKFVHASVANGVTITDMFEPYYVKHLVGVGRLENGVAVYHPGNIYKSPNHKKKKKKISKKKRPLTKSKKK